MKFCSECGTKFVGSAKFCGECGKPRTDAGQIGSASTIGQGLDWESFVKTYKPKKNQFAEINEAFDGYLFPSWGAVGDWLRFEDLEYVWSIEAKEDDLQSLTCKSGRWSGPDILGYFYCNVRLPETEDIEFELPDSYSNFRGFVLKRGEDSQKWRPCAYRLVGDATSKIGLDQVDNLEQSDSLHRDYAEASKFLRAQNQAMLRVSVFQESERDYLAQVLDSRYFMLCSAPFDGWDEFYVDVYEPLADSHLVGGELDFCENLMMFNHPITAHDEVVSRCPICDAEVDDESDEYSDHICMDGDIHEETFASFNTSSKFQYLQVNLPLSEAQGDEPGFRRDVLPFLHRELLSGNLIGFDYHERESHEMADEPFQLAFRREEYSFEKLTKSCTRCFKYNPQTAQVCYNCCLPFVERVRGQVFAALVNEFHGDEVEEMESKTFSEWANIYYFVVQNLDEVEFVAPPVPAENALVDSLSAQIAPLSGVDGFFNFIIEFDKREWNFSGSTTEGNDEILITLAGKTFSENTMHALETCSWATVNSQDVFMVEKWHAFATEDDCADLVKLGLGWLQLITGALPGHWEQNLEVHFGL